MLSLANHQEPWLTPPFGSHRKRALEKEDFETLDLIEVLKVNLFYNFRKTVYWPHIHYF